MSHDCIVGFCKNKGVHILPRDENLRAQWLQAIVHIKRLILPKRPTLCTAHFKETDYCRPPLSLLQAVPDGGRRVLKRTAIPSIFPWTTTEKNRQPKTPIKTYARSHPKIAFAEEILLPCADEDNENEDPLKIDTEDSMIETNTEDTTIGTDAEDRVEDKDTADTDAEDRVEDKDTADSYSGNDIVGEIDIPIENEFLQDIETERHSKAVQTENYVQGFSVRNFKDDDKGLHHYTGLENFDKLMLVFTTLGPSAHKLNYFYRRPPEKLDALECFFITLIILRTYMQFQEVARLFQVTVVQIYNIFTTWIRFMSFQWKNVDLWPDRETVRAHMPLHFYDQYPATRVILDATECPIKRPRLPLAQQVTFSSYKNRNTVKFLIGITPGGLISYISPCYGGSTSDRQILERSSILDRFDPNDEIMVDKGFNVQDIFLPYNVKVNMPSFFKKGNQIGPVTLTSNRKIASKRVHVERVIGLLKTYKILTQPMNQTEVILSSDIAFVCAMLVNFRSNIMSGKPQRAKKRQKAVLSSNNKVGKNKKHFIKKVGTKKKPQRAKKRQKAVLSSNNKVGKNKKHFIKKVGTKKINSLRLGQTESMSSTACVSVLDVPSMLRPAFAVLDTDGTCVPFRVQHSKRQALTQVLCCSCAGHGSGVIQALYSV